MALWEHFGKFCLGMKVSVSVIDMPKPEPMLDSGQVIDAAIVMIISQTLTIIIHLMIILALLSSLW